MTSEDPPALLWGVERLTCPSRCGRHRYPTGMDPVSTTAAARARATDPHQRWPAVTLPRPAEPRSRVCHSTRATRGRGSLVYDDGVADEMRIVTDIDAEPEPLRSRLRELVRRGAAELDELEEEAERLLTTAER